MSQVVGEDPADDIRALESHWRRHGALSTTDQAHLVNSWLLLGELGRALELAARFAREAQGSIAAEALVLRLRALDDPVGADESWRARLTSPDAGWAAFQHYAEYLALTDRRAAALDAALHGLSRHPDRSTNLLSTAARIALSVPDLDPEAFRTRFSEAVRRELGAPTQPPSRQAGSRSPLRVGILGCSLHFHPILGFVAPLLRGLDRKRFSLRVYSAGVIRDAYQAALRGLSDEWLDVAELQVPQLVDRLRADRLDVLIELDNHTRDNRLAALAQRVAPVQISLFGMNQTTGVEAIDYRITDGVVDPPGSETAYTERLLRLPSCHLGYVPFGELPPVPPAACLQSARLRMGVFNSWHKIGGGEVALWASLLEKLGGLQLVVAGFDDGVARLRLQAQLGAARIAPDRIEIHPFIEQSRFWSLVQSVDFALDSYPWGGGATSASILSLGVPLLTRTGPRAASRVSASMLLALDMGRWVLPVQADVLERIVELTADRAALDALRRPLQQRFIERFCQPEAYAASYADALEQACSAR